MVLFYFLVFVGCVGAEGISNLKRANDEDMRVDKGDFVNRRGGQKS